MLQDLPATLFFFEVLRHILFLTSHQAISVVLRKLTSSQDDHTFPILRSFLTQIGVFSAKAEFSKSKIYSPHLSVIILLLYPNPALDLSFSSVLYFSTKFNFLYHYLFLPTCWDTTFNTPFVCFPQLSLFFLSYSLH